MKHFSFPKYFYEIPSQKSFCGNNCVSSIWLFQSYMVMLLIYLINTQKHLVSSCIDTNIDYLLVSPICHEYGMLDLQQSLETALVSSQVDRLAEKNDTFKK